MNFVIPEGIKILQSKLSVNSNQIIPSFDVTGKLCNRLNLITFDESYKTNITNGDFLLFLGVINQPDAAYAALSVFCFVGNKFKIFLL